MAVMKIVIIVMVIGWIGHLVAAQDKVCSSFCSSLGMLQSTPGKSCNDIYQINKVSRGVSGNYWTNTTTGVHQVYCDMELECGGHKGGWMRIADLDTSRGDDCPSGWTEITTPVAACIAPIVTMLDVTLLISPLLVFHTVKYAEWQWVIREGVMMVLLHSIPHHQSIIHM